MRGIGAGTRVFSLLSRKPAIPPDTGLAIERSKRGMLAFENVRFSYPSRREVQILDGFSLRLAVGESVALV